MAGLDPAIHCFHRAILKWIAGSEARHGEKLEVFSLNYPYATP